jgi:hypothetical protein
VNRPRGCIVDSVEPQAVSLTGLLRDGGATVTATELAPRTSTLSGVSQWLQRIRTATVPAKETPSVWLHTGQR